MRTGQGTEKVTVQADGLATAVPVRGSGPRWRLPNALSRSEGGRR